MSNNEYKEDKGFIVPKWLAASFSGFLLVVLGGFTAWVDSVNGKLGDINNTLSAGNVKVQELTIQQSKTSALLSIVREEQLKRTGNVGKVTELAEKIKELDLKIHDHLADPTLHRPQLRILSLRIDQLEKEVKELKEKQNE